MAAAAAAAYAPQWQGQGTEYWDPAASAAYANYGYGSQQWSAAAASAPGVQKKGGASAKQKGGGAKGGSAAPSQAAAQQITQPPGQWFATTTAAPPRPVAMPPGNMGVQDRFASSQFRPHRLCNHWMRTAVNGKGWCNKEDQCTFAHGVHELHRDAQAQAAAACAVAVAPAPALPPGNMMAMPPGGLSPKGLFEQKFQRPNSGGLMSTRPPASLVTQSVGGQLLSPLATGTGSLLATAGGPMGSPRRIVTQSVGQAGFMFNTDAPCFFAPSNFSADAQAFVPGGNFGADAQVFVPGGESQEATFEQLTLPLEADEAAVAADASPTLPIARRQAPAPLTAIGGETPKGGARPAVLLPSPTASMAMSPRAVLLPSPTASSAAPGTRVVSLAMSPKASMSPTSKLFTMGSLVAPTSPMAQGLRSPTAMVMTPKQVMMSPSATVFDRQTLLQGRTFAKRIEVGPPGLGMCAPTPTSAARGFGFAYPQPGYIATLPAKQARKVSIGGKM